MQHNKRMLPDWFPLRSNPAANTGAIKYTNSKVITQSSFRKIAGALIMDDHKIFLRTLYSSDIIPEDTSLMISIVRKDNLIISLDTLLTALGAADHLASNPSASSESHS